VAFFRSPIFVRAAPGLLMIARVVAPFGPRPLVRRPRVGSFTSRQPFPVGRAAGLGPLYRSPALPLLRPGDPRTESRAFPCESAALLTIAVGFAEMTMLTSVALDPPQSVWGGAPSIWDFLSRAPAAIPPGRPTLGTLIGLSPLIGCALNCCPVAHRRQSVGRGLTLQHHVVSPDRFWKGNIGGRTGTLYDVLLKSLNLPPYVGPI